MSQYHRRISGAARQKRNRAILAASDVCHICGHPNADAVDHVIALARGGADEPGNMAPAHHQPCPDCDRRCNLEKGTKDWAPRIIRRSSSLDRP